MVASPHAAAATARPQRTGRAESLIKASLMKVVRRMCLIGSRQRRSRWRAEASFAVRINLLAYDIY
jgi:hypothetical protein